MFKTRFRPPIPHETAESRTQKAERLTTEARKLANGEDGVAKDVREAVNLYRKAAELGNASAMFSLAILLRKGEDGVAKDVGEAVKLCRRAAELGSTSAMHILAALLRSGEDGVAKDVGEAVKLYYKAAELGNTSAMFNLAVLLRNGEDGVAKDVGEAVKLYYRAAERGNTTAMHNLAILLQNGDDGVPKNVREAVKLYYKAAELGNVPAMHNLAILLRNGEDGVAKDVRETVKLYRKAAEFGSATAMYNLGVLCQEGEEGVARDVGEAVKLYRKAAQLGNAAAMNNLGALLQDGEDGITKDVRMAAKMYRQAANLGDSNAMSNLGVLLVRGEHGVAKNLVEAEKLFRQAADLGNVTAMKRLEELLERNTKRVQRAPHRAAQPICEGKERGLEQDRHGFSKIRICRAGIETQDAQEGQCDQPMTKKANPRFADIYPVSSANLRKYEVFISHAGPDKLAMAEPICKALEFIDVHAFLDKNDLKMNDCTGPEAMQHAMHEAGIGIFVLSPEFAARKWTMRELRHFLERDRTCEIEGIRRPVLLPIFFRLSLEECTRAHELVYGQASKYGQILFSNGFFNPERQKECSTVDAIEALRRVTRYSGVELPRIGGGADLSTAEVMAETVSRVRAYIKR